MFLFLFAEILEVFMFLWANINAYNYKGAYIFKTSFGFFIELQNFSLCHRVENVFARLKEIISKVNNTITIIIVELFLMLNRSKTFIRNDLSQLFEVF